MAYRVALAASAEADIEALYRRVVSEAPFRGREWFERLLDAIRSLEHFPNRCPLAREASRIDRAIRCLLFGKRRNVYRILYEVNETALTVLVLHVRHGARGDMISARGRSKEDR